MEATLEEGFGSKLAVLNHDPIRLNPLSNKFIASKNCNGGVRPRSYHLGYPTLELLALYRQS
jgi:hypothetical protein